jgi:uncharacterized RDD family membrane protein YckC
MTEPENPAMPPEPSASPPPSDDSIERDLGLAVKVCPGCRTRNLPTSVYCYKCGLKLPEQALTPDQLAPVRAGFWRRLAAYLIDYIFISVLASVLFEIALSFFPGMETQFGSSGGSVEQQVQLLLDFISSPLYWASVGGSFLLEMAYFTVSVGWKAKTVGMLMLGMKVVRTDGHRVGYGRAFARWCGYIICWMTVGVGFLLIAFNRDKQGLHDMIVDTTVIRT